MPRSTSDIWQYFSIVPSEAKVKKAKCSFCGHEQSSGITRLSQHLAEKCQAIPINLREELRPKFDVKFKSLASMPYSLNGTNEIQDAYFMLARESAHHTLSSSSSSSTSGLHHFSTASPAAPQPGYDIKLQPTTTRQILASEPLDPSEQTSFDWHLARAFYASHIPFAAIEHPSIVDFFRRLRPGYQIPRKRRLEQFMLKTEHWDLIEYEAQRPDQTANNIRKNMNLVAAPNTNGGQEGGSDDADGGM